MAPQDAAENSGGGVSFFFCAFSRLLGSQFAKNVFGNGYNGGGSHAGSPDKTRNREKSGMELKMVTNGVHHRIQRV